MSNDKAEATISLAKETDEKTEAQPTVKESKLNKKLRAFPLWLRVVTFIVLLLIVIFAGLSVGYSVLGGGDAADVFKTETWTHIFDIMNGKE